MRVLYLTNNPNRGGTVRILQSWFLYARTCGITPVVAVTPGSKFAGWLRDNDVEFIENPMPLPSNTKPWESVWHAARLALWARSHRVDLIHCNEHDVYRFASVVRGFLRVPIVCHIRFTISHPLAKWLFAGARRPGRAFAARGRRGTPPGPQLVVVAARQDHRVAGGERGHRAVGEDQVARAGRDQVHAAQARVVEDQANGDDISIQR